jgi:hypothetical protein
VVFAADETKWMRVEPKDGNCALEFPGKPTETVDDKKNTEVALEAMEGKAVYMLKFHDLPSKVATDQADTVKKIFDSGQTGLLQKLKGKLAKSEDGKFGKHPSRDIDVEVPMLGLYRVKLVLTGDRLYQVIAAGPAEFVKGDNVKKYMESFKLNE